MEFEVNRKQLCRSSFWGLSELLIYIMMVERGELHCASLWTVDPGPLLQTWFGLRRVPSGLTQGFPYHEGGSHFIGVRCHGNSRAGYVQDKSFACMKDRLLINQCSWKIDRPLPKDNVHKQTHYEWRKMHSGKKELKNHSNYLDSLNQIFWKVTCFLWEDRCASASACVIL